MSRIFLLFNKTMIYLWHWRKAQPNYFRINMKQMPVYFISWKLVAWLSLQTIKRIKNCHRTLESIWKLILIVILFETKQLRCFWSITKSLNRFILIFFPQLILHYLLSLMLAIYYIYNLKYKQQYFALGIAWYSIINSTKIYF